MSKVLYYDGARRRLWILGQRCHHGATGVLLAAAGTAVKSTAMIAAGSALMLHDWHDRSIWFQPGWQDQP